MLASPFAALRPDRRLLVYAAALLSLATAVARSAPASNEPKLPADARLDKAVTLKLRKSPLSEVAAALSREAGVTVRAAEGVADEPAMVWIKEQPAREVMRQLAKLFDYRWRVSGAPGEYQYELYQDLNGKRTEELLREQDRFRALEALRAELQERNAARPQDQPNSGRQADLLVASLITPAHWNALARGRILQFSTSPRPGDFPLPAGVAQRLLQLNRSRESPPNPRPPDGVSVRLWITFTTSEVTLYCFRDFTFPQGWAREGGMLATSNGRYLPPSPPDDPKLLAKWRSDPLLKLARPFGVDPRKAAPRKRPSPSGVTFLHLYEILPELAEAYGINLISDAYWAQPFWVQPPAVPAEAPLYEVLRKYVAGVADWTKDGAHLRVRSRTWFYDRSAEIPQRVIRTWSEKLRRERRTTLESEAALALSLRDEQRSHFLAGLQEEGVYLHEEDSHHQEGSREILRAYASLSESQQQLLRSGGELPFARLPPAARTWLRASFERRQRSFMRPNLPFLELPPGSLSLSATTVQRVITSHEQDQVDTTLRVLDGPNAGQQIGRFGRKGALPPGFAEGNQIFQKIVFRYRVADQQVLSFNVDLPWVYVDPSVRPSTPPPAGR